MDAGGHEDCMRYSTNTLPAEPAAEDGPSTAVHAPAPAPQRSCFTYTSCYCEENVYFLCKRLIQMRLTSPLGRDLFVVFISNKAKKVPLWWQKASKRDDMLVLWDYHVICIQLKTNPKGGDSHLVWDLDSALPFPSSLTQYATKALQLSLPLQDKYKRFFRVVHVPIFLQCFASDRSHMRDSQGNWLSPPPAYSPIISVDGTTNNLNEFIQVGAEDVTNQWDDLVDNIFCRKLGAVIGETQLVKLFSRLHERLR